MSVAERKGGRKKGDYQVLIHFVVDLFYAVLRTTSLIRAVMLRVADHPQDEKCCYCSPCVAWRRGKQRYYQLLTRSPKTGKETRTRKKKSYNENENIPVGQCLTCSTMGPIKHVSRGYLTWFQGGKSDRFRYSCTFQRRRHPCFGR